jgi:hypothetical protein
LSKRPNALKIAKGGFTANGTTRDNQPRRLKFG